MRSELHTKSKRLPSLIRIIFVDWIMNNITSTINYIIEYINPILALIAGEKLR